MAGAEAGADDDPDDEPPDSGPNSDVLPCAACEIGPDSWEAGLVPWLGSSEAEGFGDDLRASRRGAGVGVRVARATTSVARDDADSSAGPRGVRFGYASALGAGAGARSARPESQPGAWTTPVATQSAPAPAPETQKPISVAIVAMRPPPVEVAM